MDKPVSNSFEEIYKEYEANRMFDAMGEDVCLMLMICLEIKKLNSTLKILAEDFEDFKRYNF